MIRPRNAWRFLASLTFLFLLILVCIGKDPPQHAHKSSRGLSRRDINRAQLNWHSLEDDATIGRFRSETADKHLPLVRDPLVCEYINNLTQKINKRSDSPFPAHIRIINVSDISTAHSFPGGHYYLYRGLINLIESEDELAAVIGHEIGHIAARHETEALSLGLPMGESPLLSEAYYEYEADLLGAQYASYCGYDPRGGIKLLTRISKLPFINTGSGPKRTPDVSKRIESLRHALKKVPQPWPISSDPRAFLEMKQRLNELSSESLNPDLPSFLDFDIKTVSAPSKKKSRKRSPKHQGRHP